MINSHIFKVKSTITYAKHEVLYVIISFTENNERKVQMRNFSFREIQIN